METEKFVSYDVTDVSETDLINIYGIRLQYPYYHYITKDHDDSIWLYQFKPIKNRWGWTHLLNIEKPICISIELPTLKTNEVINIDKLLIQKGIEVDYV